MRAKTVLILGGGVGGLVTANELRRRLPKQHKIILVDRESKHLHNPSLLWLMMGWREPDQIQASLGKLSGKGIEVVQAEIESINPESRSVQTSVGELSADYLIVSLGAQPAPELTPGFIEAAQTPYTLDGATRLHEALQDFTGGNLIVAVTGLPYRCPAAPYESAIMIHAFLVKRGIREKTNLRMITPEGMPMATAGPEMAEAVVGMLAERDIEFSPICVTKNIDVAAKELVLESGERVAFDLLVGIPPHRSPKVVSDTKLVNDAGWVPVDGKTMATRFEGVYALGDVTTILLPGRFKPDMPLVLPKAGVFAHRQAEILAKNIAVEITGKGKAENYDGVGGCFIELGDGRASYGEGDFYSPSAPAVKLRMPAKRWHWAKALIEKYWLWRWFSNWPQLIKKIGDRIIFG